MNVRKSRDKIPSLLIGKQIFSDPNLDSMTALLTKSYFDGIG